MSSLLIWACTFLLPIAPPPAADDRPTDAATASASPAATEADRETATEAEPAPAAESASRSGTESETESAAEPPADSGADDAGPTYRLRYRFEPGQQLRYRSTQESTVDARYRGSRKTDVSKVEQQRLFTVESLSDDGVARLVMQFEHVRMEIRSGDNEPVIFDSTMDDDEIPALFRQTAHRLKGNAARYRLTAAGTPVGDSSASPQTAADSDQSADLSEAATFLLPLPEQPVAAGDTWTRESTVTVRLTKDISREVTILRTFRLQSVEDETAVITFDSSVMSRTPSVTVRAQLIQATPKGRVEFDLARGLMRKREIRFDESVLGALGPESILASWGRSEEVLVDAETPTATSAR